MGLGCRELGLDVEREGGLYISFGTAGLIKVLLRGAQSLCGYWTG